MAARTSSSQQAERRVVGYVFDERYMWHRPLSLQYTALVQPFTHWESAETKRRFHALLAVSGILQKLHAITPIPATKAQLSLVHTEQYIGEIESKSQREEGGNAGEEAPFSQFAFDIACLSTGGVVQAAEAAMEGFVSAAYALTRPPGHHATPSRGMGFCLFNNVAIMAKHLLQKYPHEIRKIAIVDYDVHHGNGTQDAFYDDDRVLFVSLHQANNYPANSGRWNEKGAGAGEGFTINVPLPPGSGSGAYKYAFERVVVPALRRFEPDFILVSSGFDASYVDPLAAMTLSSQVFRFMAQQVISVAEELCSGRVVFAHEGGYSETYVPFCGAAVIEALLHVDDPSRQIEDPFLEEVERWEYQELQVHQQQIVDKVIGLHGL